MKNAKRLLSAIVLAAEILTLSACDSSQNPQTEVTDMPIETDISVCKPVDYVQKPAADQYTFMWWPEGFRYKKDVIYFQTGTYAMSLNTVKTDTGISRLGVIPDPIPRSEAARYDNSVVEAMGEVTSRLYLQLDGERHEADTYQGVTMEGAAETGLQPSNISMISESGQFMQRVVIPHITFAGAEGMRGRLNIACTPDAFTVYPEARCEDGDVNTIGFCYELTLPAAYSDWSLGADGLTASVKAADGSGFGFVLASGGEGRIEVSGTTVTFTVTGLKGARLGYEGAAITVIPSRSASLLECRRFIAARDALKIRYAALKADGTPGLERDSDYDISRGMHIIRLSPMTADLTVPAEHNKLNRLQFTISNPTSEDIELPLAFDDDKGTAARNITGGSPMIRHAITLEPIGLPVQLSKNWHAAAWYRLYTVVTVPAKSTVTYEFAMASSKYGSAYAAAHAQLSLIGWNCNQLWDESSLGDWGESITYDKDQNANRSVIDDVRPFLMENSDMGGKWNWTGNVGGADFLVYYNERQKKCLLTGIKNDYLAQAPNLTDVVYAGQTADGRIEAVYRMQLGRTDDVVRAFYTVDYIFHEDTPFKRLALFQMAADGYSDNFFTRYAYSLDGKTVHTDAAIAEGVTGYRSEADKYIKGGENMWFYLYASDKLPEENGNLLAIVREYKATVDGKEYTDPIFNLYYNGQGSVQPSFELTVPQMENNTVPAGTTVHAVIEFIVTPANRDDYYGQSDYILAMNNDELGTPMAVLQAVSGAQTLEMKTGTLVSQYPNVIAAVKNAPDGIAAEFRLTGGLGYVPVSFTGLDRFDGWVLECDAGEGWKKVDQSSASLYPDVYPNQTTDFWQCRFDPETDSYTLTYNVKNPTLASYRLIRK